MMRISKEIAAAGGLAPEESEVVARLVDEWSGHWARNRLRDRYYYGHVRVRDIGVSVSPQLARKLDPHVDWAAKCVDWWSDRVQFDGVTVSDEASQDALDRVLAANDMRNLLHKTATVALRHSVAFLAVTSDPDTGETVVSGYPATASSAIWDESRKRIGCGLVVVESERPRGSRTRRPLVVHVYTDEQVIVLRRGAGGWSVADRVEHGMGRVPMEPVAYHPTLERPFGRSRITRTVMALVDDAQREMMNMTAAAAFAAAPQKFLLDVDKSTGKKIAESGFDAFIGSIFTATANSKGRKPDFGQLAQLSMQPHLDYMRSLGRLQAVGRHGLRHGARRGGRAQPRRAEGAGPRRGRALPQARPTEHGEPVSGDHEPGAGDPVARRLGRGPARARVRRRAGAPAQERQEEVPGAQGRPGGARQEPGDR